MKFKTEKMNPEDSNLKNLKTVIALMKTYFQHELQHKNRPPSFYKYINKCIDHIDKISKKLDVNTTSINQCSLIEDELYNFFIDPSEHGCKLHLMTKLPPNNVLYVNSYIYIKNDKENTQTLYYIDSAGKYKKVPIKDFSLFETTINGIKNENDTQLDLDKKQIEEIVTSNGGHIPKNKPPQFKTGIIDSPIENPVNSENDTNDNTRVHRLIYTINFNISKKTSFKKNCSKEYFLSERIREYLVNKMEEMKEPKKVESINDSIDGIIIRLDKSYSAHNQSTNLSQPYQDCLLLLKSIKNKEAISDIEIDSILSRYADKNGADIYELKDKPIYGSTEHLEHIDNFKKHFEFKYNKCYVGLKKQKRDAEDIQSLYIDHKYKSVIYYSLKEHQWKRRKLDHAQRQEIKNILGNDLHVMSKLPDNCAEYKSSYIFIKENNCWQLYYITQKGEAIKAEVTDLNLFEKNINALVTKDETTIHLSGEQIQKIVTSNGGHAPEPKNIYNNKADVFKIATICKLTTEWKLFYRINKQFNNVYEGIEEKSKQEAKSKKIENILHNRRQLLSKELAATFDKDFKTIEKNITKEKKRILRNNELSCNYADNFFNKIRNKLFDMSNNKSIDTYQMQLNGIRNEIKEAEFLKIDEEMNKELYLINGNDDEIFAELNERIKNKYQIKLNALKEEVSSIQNYNSRYDLIDRLENENKEDKLLSWPDTFENKCTTIETKIEETQKLILSHTTLSKQYNGPAFNVVKQFQVLFETKIVESYKQRLDDILHSKNEFIKDKLSKIFEEMANNSSHNKDDKYKQIKKTLTEEFHLLINKQLQELEHDLSENFNEMINANLLFNSISSFNDFQKEVETKISNINTYKIESSPIDCDELTDYYQSLYEYTQGCNNTKNILDKTPLTKHFENKDHKSIESIVKDNQDKLMTLEQSLLKKKKTLEIKNTEILLNINKKITTKIDLLNEDEKTIEKINNLYQAFENLKQYLIITPISELSDIEEGFKKVNQLLNKETQCSLMTGKFTITGRDLYTMSSLPESFDGHKNSYIFLKTRDTSKLYYINTKGVAQELTSTNIDLLTNKIERVNNDHANKIHLSREEIQQIVSGNHNPEPKYNENQFNDELNLLQSNLNKTLISIEDSIKMLNIKESNRRINQAVNQFLESSIGITLAGHLKNKGVDKAKMYLPGTLKKLNIYDKDDVVNKLENSFKKFHLHFMSTLPQNCNPYANSYICINDKELYYIKPDGKCENVNISDPFQFERAITSINKNGDTQLPLDAREINLIVSSCEGHIPYFIFNENGTTLNIGVFEMQKTLLQKQSTEFNDYATLEIDTIKEFVNAARNCNRNFLSNELHGGLAELAIDYCLLSKPTTDNPADNPAVMLISVLSKLYNIESKMVDKIRDSESGLIRTIQNICQEKNINASHKIKKIEEAFHNTYSDIRKQQGIFSSRMGDELENLINKNKFLHESLGKVSHNPTPFLKPYERDVLIGISIALLVFVTITISVFTFGAAALPGIAVVGTAIGLSGSVATGFGLAAIGTACIGAFSAVAGGVGAITRRFSSKNRDQSTETPTKEPSPSGLLPSDSTSVIYTQLKNNSGGGVKKGEEVQKEKEEEVQKQKEEEVQKQKEEEVQKQKEEEASQSRIFSP